MSLPSWTDLALAAVVGVIALVPAGLAFLGLAILLRALGAPERLGPRGYRLLATTLALTLAVASLLLTWVLAGATHLKPRCVARAEPVYASTLYLDGSEDETPVAIAVGTLLLEADGTGSGPPAWADALLGPGGFPYYEWRRPDGTVARVNPDGSQVLLPAASAGAVLRVQRRSGRSSYWARITVDRFTLLDRASGTLLADGEEMWVDAGPARYRCGIASGPVPVAGKDYPPGDGVARFLRKAVRPLG